MKSSNLACCCRKLRAAGFVVSSLRVKCMRSWRPFCCGPVDEAAVLDGVDAKEIIVVGGTDEAFELREDIRCPASCRSERAEALAQETLVDRRRDTHLMHPT